MLPTTPVATMLPSGPQSLALEVGQNCGFLLVVDDLLYVCSLCVLIVFYVLVVFDGF